MKTVVQNLSKLNQLEMKALLYAMFGHLLEGDCIEMIYKTIKDTSI